MQIRLISILALAGLISTASQAQSTVNYSAAIGERDVYYDGAPAANGNQVSLGYFDAGFDVLTHGADSALLFSHWNVMGDTTISEIWSQAGRFSDSAFTTDPQFDDQQIWMWIFKTPGNTTPALDFRDVEAYGLFSSTQSNWIFPSQGALPMFSTVSINSSEVNQAAYGYFDASHLFLVAVPEPPSWLLSSLGLGALMLWWQGRRRQTRGAGDPCARP